MGYEHTGQPVPDHAGHGHAEYVPAGGWRTAVQATLHCLTGCAIGEVLGMVIGTSLGLHAAATVALSVVLAFVFGYALTMRGVLRAGVDLRQALKVAPAADTVSIAVMELIDSTVVVTVPGAIDAGPAALGGPGRAQPRACTRAAPARRSSVWVTPARVPTALA